MTWPYSNGSFRGVPFYVDANTGGGARALVAHEIPLGVGEIWEDLGPESEPIAFEAYLVGRVPANVTAFNPALDPVLNRDQISVLSQPEPTLEYWRDRLLDALELAGPGTLLHPTRGEIWARARRWSFQELRGEQGYIRLTLEFVRDRELEATTTTPARSATGEASDRSDSIYRASGERVVDELNVSSLERARAATETELRALSRKLRELDRFTAPGQQAADLARQATNLLRDVKALAVAPANLVSTVVTAIRDVERAAADVPSALAAYEVLLQLVPTIVGSDLEDHNTRLVNGLIRGSALSGALRAAVRMSWDSYEQATGVRDRLLARIEELAPYAGDEEYDALMEAQASFVGLVPPEDEKLPRIGSFTPAATTTALLVAWRLYGDRDREADILARNRVSNPNFVRGGRPLEVLVDA